MTRRGGGRRRRGPNGAPPGARSTLRRGLLVGLNLALGVCLIVLLALAGSAGQPSGGELDGTGSSAASTAPQARAPQAVDRLLSHTSQARGEEVRLWTFAPVLPPGSAPLPVLYLLHGAGGDHDSWHRAARDQLLDLALRHGLVVVAPDGRSRGWYLDSPRDPSSRLESWLLRELIPFVERSDLPVAPGPANRAIAGLSMGGHGALVLALRNPGTFASASSMSGIVDPLRHPRSWGLPAVLGALGPDTRPVWQDHSALHLLGREDTALPPGGLLLTVGSDDEQAAAENRDLHDALVARGIEHGWKETSGGHDWSCWLGALPDHFAFHAAALSRR